jgi:RNA polymerase sigma-70 factor (ECF subfamily)
MEHTETLIVEQLKIGNEDAYQYIYDRHYALLCHVASGYVKDQFSRKPLSEILFSFMGDS